MSDEFLKTTFHKLRDSLRKKHSGSRPASGPSWSSALTQALQPMCGNFGSGSAVGAGFTLHRGVWQSIVGFPSTTAQQTSTPAASSR
eukprot:3869533-Amphidinium_carterae.1